MVADDFEVEPCDVLVVDDQIFHRDMVAEMLRAKAIRVSTVTSGDEAIAAYVRLEVKPIVLMDNIMPRMTGVEATSALRSIDPAAKVIFVSSDISNRAEALAAGAIGFIMKPFKVAEVFAAIRWAMSNPAPGQGSDSGGHEVPPSGSSPPSGGA